MHFSTERTTHLPIIRVVAATRCQWQEGGDPPGPCLGVRGHHHPENTAPPPPGPSTSEPVILLKSVNDNEDDVSYELWSRLLFVHPWCCTCWTMLGPTYQRKKHLPVSGMFWLVCNICGFIPGHVYCLCLGPPLSITDASCIIAHACIIAHHHV